MIDLLGIGVPSPTGEWLFRGVCAHLESGQLTAVVSREATRRSQR